LLSSTARLATALLLFLQEAAGIIASNGESTRRMGGRTWKNSMNQPKKQNKQIMFAHSYGLVFTQKCSYFNLVILG
jgi:hypothetical protein